MWESGVIAAIANGAAKVAATTIAKPFITSSMKGVKNLTDPVLDSLIDRFSEYIHVQLNKHSYLNTLVFGNQTPLENLYIPLTIIPCTQNKEDNSDEITLDHYSPDFLPKFKRVLITDTAGMGKSTLLRFIFIKCVEEDTSIPIFIELRQLKENNGILQIVQSQLNLDLSPNQHDDQNYFTRTRVERLFKKGGVTLLLDGYDEIPFIDREEITREIKNFIDKFPNNTYAITSRPESGLEAFGNFKQFKIRPLKKDESFNLIRKYSNNNAQGELLIKQISGKNFTSISDFLTNPLLVTLLFRCFEYKQSIPLKKHIFYRQVYDALYNGHDTTKDGYNTREKKSNLDIDSFHQVLRVMGYVCTMQGKIETDKDGILDWIRKARAVCSGLNFSESNFLDDAVRAVPIFVKDGLYYRWSHKSLAEYFAAQFLCLEGKLEQEKILSRISNSSHLDRFSNLLDQFYDVDYSAFNKYIYLPLKDKIKQHSSSTYLNLDSRIPNEIIKIRKGVCYSREFYIKQPKNIVDIPLKSGRAEWDMMFSEFLIKEKPLGGIEFIQNKTIDIIGFLNKNDYVIINILAAKKDPLILAPAKLDFTNIKRTKIIKLRGAKLIDDSPLNVLNSFENFSLVTKLLASSNHVIDLDHLDKSINAYENEQALSELTENLFTNEFI